MQKITVALFFILAAIQTYLAVSAPGGLNLRGAALIAIPLSLMIVNLAEYPKFKQTAARIPMIAFGLALGIASVYILFVHKFL